MVDESMQSLEAAVREAYLDEAAELLRRIDVAENALTGSKPETRSEFLRAIARALHTLKGASSASGEEGVKNECHRVEELIADVDGSQFDPAGEVGDALREGIARLHALLERVARRKDPARTEPTVPTHGTFDSVAPSSITGAAVDVLRVRPERVDALHALASELVVLRLQTEAQLRRLADTRDAISEICLASERVMEIERRRKGRASHEAGTKASRSLESFASELASRHAELAEIASVLGATNAETGNVADSILSSVGDLRMMPLAPFFESFVSVARDAAGVMGTEVRVSIRAEGAELDRAVLTRLREPVLHLVRNAVAHGIESTGARERAGKHAVGHVLLEGRSEGSRAILRVVDDGAGIDVRKVRVRAVAMGLLDASSTEALDGERLFEILAKPGFSTRTEVDRLAGRGVGLDVVADVVRSLGGRVAVETFEGMGTSITIEVPVTASTSAGLLVRCAEHRFAILLSHVERVVRTRKSELRSSASVTTFRIENDAVAVVALAPLLGIPESKSLDETVSGVVVSVGRQRLLFLVDELPGEQSLIVRPMPEAFARASNFVGAAVEADGSVLPVLDIAALFARVVDARAGDRLEPLLDLGSERVEGGQVLVVDDSVTMRTLLRNILRSSGYDVVVAHDGRSALDALDALDRCDLVVTDLEMPGMDGSELCHTIRRSKFARVPIVMVTSVASDEQKNRAMLAGADAYVVKSAFVQQDFLELARTLVRRESSRT